MYSSMNSQFQSKAERAYQPRGRSSVLEGGSPHRTGIFAVGRRPFGSLAERIRQLFMLKQIFLPEYIYTVK